MGDAKLGALAHGARQIPPSLPTVGKGVEAAAVQCQALGRMLVERLMKSCGEFLERTTQSSAGQLDKGVLGLAGAMGPPQQPHPSAVWQAGSSEDRKAREMDR